MKRLLLATAAVIALAVAAPMAAAQYTSPPPATAPYTTPVPDDPMTPQDESVAGQADTTATQSQSQLTTPAAPETTAQAQTGATAPYDQTQPYSAQAQTGTTDQYAANENTATPARLEEHARDAGMDHLPMTAQEVCMPREISLTTSGSRLNRDKQHQLINAADRASVCDVQRIVIHSPNGRADQARQLLVDNGVDASMIEVQDTDSGGLDVEMNFSGLATSSEQYAQLFNAPQYASYQPSTTSAPAPTYEPSPSAPPLEEPASPSPGDDTTADANGMDDGMSPTSGEPVVQPGMLDI